MISYFLQVVLFQLLFLLVFEILLKRETFFTYNRWYLLTTSVLALILPFLKIEALAYLIPAEALQGNSMVWLPEIFIGEAPAAAQSLGTTEASGELLKINWWLLAYGTGVVVSLKIFFRNYQNLRRLFRFRAISSEKDLRIIEVPNSSIACTFYKTIFLGDKLSEAEKLQILSHELVHVKQKHSLDLMFLEVLKIIFWFNPLVYVYQNRMAAVHEFIADATVVKSTPKKSYYEQLLNSAFNTTNISFINQFFNHSLIKKRIVMLQKSRSKTTAKLKYLVMIPLMLAMLTYVACSDENSTMNYQEEDSLSQYSYTMNKHEKMSDDKREIHKKYEEFLINNPGYVSWATIEGNQITYSVHSGDEEVPEGYIKLEVSDKYDMYINLPGSTKNNNEKEKSETIEYAIGDDIPFAVIEEVPVFPGCENLETNEERKNCMSQKVQEHVQKEFNTSLGKELGLKGLNRVIAIFKINSQGQVIDVRSRAPHPELEEEATRVINSLPVMTPGKQNGQAVNVSYSLPIVFQVGE